MKRNSNPNVLSHQFIFYRCNVSKTCGGFYVKYSTCGVPQRNEIGMAKCHSARWEFIKSVWSRFEISMPIGRYNAMKEQRGHWGIAITRCVGISSIDLILECEVYYKHTIGK